MQIKEKQIAKFNQNKTKIELIEQEYVNAGVTTNTAGEPMYYSMYKYQIRINRKRIYTTKYEDAARRKLSMLIYEEILQKKIL